MNQPTTNRRGLLRLGSGLAACAVGGTIITGAAAASDAGAVPAVVAAWNAAMAEHHARRADFEVAICACDTASRGSEDYRRWLEEEQRTSDADDDAMKALMLTPAPDLRAVSFKVDLAREFELSLDGIHADLRRLDGREG